MKLTATVLLLFLASANPLFAESSPISAGGHSDEPTGILIRDTAAEQDLYNNRGQGYSPKSYQVPNALRYVNPVTQYHPTAKQKNKKAQPLINNKKKTQNNGFTFSQMAKQITVKKKKSNLSFKDLAKRIKNKEKRPSKNILKKKP